MTWLKDPQSWKVRVPGTNHASCDSDFEWVICVICCMIAVLNWSNHTAKFYRREFPLNSGRDWHPTFLKIWHYSWEKHFRLKDWWKCSSNSRAALNLIKAVVHSAPVSQAVQAEEWYSRHTIEFAMTWNWHCCLMAIVWTLLLDRGGCPSSIQDWEPLWYSAWKCWTVFCTQWPSPDIHGISLHWESKINTLGESNTGREGSTL